MKRLLLTSCVLLMALIGRATCNPSFTLTMSPNATSLLGVTLNNTSTFSGAPMNSWPQYTYNYGDGSINTYSTQHNYSSPGTYTVKLYMQIVDSVTQAVFCSDSASQNVTVNYTPCGATFSSVINSSMNGQVTFTAANPANTPGITYSWNFGDNTTGTGSPVTHTYAANGYKTVTLTTTVGGANPCTYTVSANVYVNNVPIACSTLHALFSSTVSGNTVYFSNTSTAITGYNRSFYWDFGDGNTLTTTGTASHYYTAPGTYTVKLKTTWTNQTFPSFICQDSVIHTVTVAPLNCANLHASFSPGINYTTVYFSNSSTNAPGYVRHFSWSFGDGGTSTAMSPSHTYSNLGTYTVWLTTYWMDSATNTVLCSDSVSHTVPVNSSPNNISGYIVTDSITTLPNQTDTFKVWLIQFNATTNILSAVDSTIAAGHVYTPFQFNNEPNGNYLVKAKMISGPTSGYGYVPTYHDSSLYWNTALSFAHAGGFTGGKYIWMKQGTITSGPGFIGGNVSLGANKGTSGGVPGMTVLLRNQNNKLVASAYTDANGDFSISNIPTGTYSLYPEQMNYTTTPYTVTISSTKPSVSGISFHQDDAKMSIMAHTSGIPTLSGKQQVHLYPNPARGIVTLSWEGFTMKNGQVTITGITGQQVLKAALTDNGSSQLLHLSQLQPGIYFVHLDSEQAGTTLKLVVQ